MNITRKLKNWEVGLLVGVVLLLGLTLAAVAYRLMSLLLGDDYAQITIGLAVVIGFGAGVFDYLSDRMRA